MDAGVPTGARPVTADPHAPGPSASVVIAARRHIVCHRREPDRHIGALHICALDAPDMPVTLQLVPARPHSTVHPQGDATCDYGHTASPYSVLQPPCSCSRRPPALLICRSGPPLDRTPPCPPTAHTGPPWSRALT